MFYIYDKTTYRAILVKYILLSFFRVRDGILRCDLFSFLLQYIAVEQKRRGRETY